MAAANSLEDDEDASSGDDDCDRSRAKLLKDKRQEEILRYTSFLFPQRFDRVQDGIMSAQFSQDI